MTHTGTSGSRTRVGCGSLLLLALSLAGCQSMPHEARPPAPPAEDVETTVLLVGDAGDPDPAGEPVLEALTAELRRSDTPALVVFLGDNIYPAGMPRREQPGRKEAERRLKAQLDAALAAAHARVIMVPGNHDWNFSGLDGWARVIEQEAFAESVDGARIEYLPDRGCPGPAVRDVGTRLRLIFIDTEWWLRTSGRPYGESSPCVTKNEAEVLESLRAALAGAGDRQVIVAGHHPLVTVGVHGGHFTFRQHFFPLTDWQPWLWVPLPIIGSAYPISRQLGITSQDLAGPRYARMRASLRAVFEERPPLAHAAGHEHSLQLLQGEGTRYQIVSGAAIFGHATNVGWNAATLYAERRSGFVRLDVQRDGRVRLAMIVVDADGTGKEDFSWYLD